MAKKYENTGDWRPAFLRYLGKHPNVSKAAKAAGVSRMMAYIARDVDEDFAAEWDDALNTSLDQLEETAFKRANTSSDILTIFMLKSHRPQTYRDPVNRVSFTDPSGEKDYGASLTISDIDREIMGIVDAARARAATKSGPGEEAQMGSAREGEPDSASG